MIQCRSIGQITRAGLVSPCRRDCPRLLKSMQFIYGGMENLRKQRRQQLSPEPLQPSQLDPWATAD